MFDEQDRKYFYNEFKNNGYEVGSYDDFKQDLNNKEDRDWYYNEAKNMGYDVGSQEDFDKMVLDPAPSSSSTVSSSSSTQSSPVATSAPQAEAIQQPQANNTQQQAESTKQANESQGLLYRIAGMPMQHAVVSNGTYQPAPVIEQPIVDGISGQQPAHRTPVTNQPVDAVTGANSEEDIDAIFGKYIGKGDAISETIADLMASGKANSQEQAQPLAMAALNRAAQRLAKRTADDFVGKLGDTVANIDQSIYNGWYSHDIQDALKSSADQLGIYNNYFENEQGGVEEVKTYDLFINRYVKPAMVESLVHKYGENYRKQAEDIATRLYSHDDAVQGELMNRDINSAIEGVVSKYVQPSVVEEYNKAQEAGKEAFNASANENLHLPGSAFASLMAESKAKDAQKTLDTLNKKFANLYKNGSFLTDIANATYNVMLQYGAQGGLSGKPEQFKPMIQGVLKNELTQLEVKGLMPKGSADYIIKSGLGNTILGKIERKALHSDYQNWLEDMANQQYQPGFWENVASGALTFAGDAWSYWLPGAAGGKITKSMLAKAEGRLATDLFAKGMSEKAAERAAKLIVGRSKSMALKQGMVHGATTFGGQAVASTPVNEIYKEGQPDEEGKTYKTSVGKILYNTLGDVVKGAALGAVMQGGTLANIAGKGRGLAANILTDVGGKIADSSIMAGQSIIEHMAADPSFKPTGKDAARSFLESMANLTAIGLPGMMGKYTRFKSTQEFNRKYDFTNEDLESLNRLGYGNLYEAFKDMGINDNRMLEGDGELMGQLSQKYMDFMSSKSVPETLKAKVMAVVEGKRPDSFSPVMDSQIIQPVDGKPIVETYNEDGGIIERKQYSSIEAAEKANKKLDFEKSLNLTAAYESAYHSDAMQDRLNTQYQLAVNKYNVGEKLSDEDKAAIYLHQNADAIKDVVNKQQQGMELTDKEQQLWSSYKRIYDGVFENSPIMKEYILTFEDSMGVPHGTLRKALEGDGKSRTKEQQQLVEAYQKQLYGDIVLRRDGRMDQVVKYTGNPKEGDKPQLTVKPSNTNSEQTSEENAAERATISVGGNNSPSDGGTPPSSPVAPVEEQPAPENMNTAEPAPAMPFESSPTTSEAFVMGQNAYNNGDSDSLKAISRNDDLSVARLQRLFKDNANQVSVIQKAYSEGKDMEEYINQRANYLTAAQKDAIRKYVEAQDAKKGVYDALQHADDGYGDSLKEQLWPYATEDGNIVPATLTSGQQVFLKKSNEYGGGFVVVPDEQAAPVIKQVASSEVKEVGIPVPFDEYIAQLTQAQQSNRAQAFFSQFDGSGMKPNETVEVAMEAGDDPVQMIFAGYSPDGKIVLSDGHDNISLPKDEFNVWKDNALQSSINAELDAEDVQRSNDEAMKAEAEKKQRYADNIVGYGEGQIDYSSKESNPKVVAEYLQEQYGEDHAKLINLINGSRHDIKEQLDNKKKLSAEYESWLDTNADLDPDKAQKVADELKLVDEQISDLEARYKNWNIIRNSVMTEDETRAMHDERKKTIEQAGIDNSAIITSEEREIPVLNNEELKKQYPSMDEASAYITSQRKAIYKIQSDEVQQDLNGVNDILERYTNGEIDLDSEQLKELNTTKAQLEARHANLNASAKVLKVQADKLKTLYRKENAAERAKVMANLSPAEQRAVKVENAIKGGNLNALNNIYEGTSVNFLDDTPNTVKEYVANNMGRNALNFEGKEVNGAFSNGVSQETGLTRKDFNKLQVLAKEGDGMTVAEFVHKLYDNLPDHLREQGINDIDIRNALLDILGSAETYQDIKNYSLREKVANAESEMRALDAEEERMRDAYEQEAMVDGQGNPINEDGSLRLEQVKSVDELTDDDFLRPSRNVELPTIPSNIDAAIGANGKPVVIKKNIFERNMGRHGDLTPEQSRNLFFSALYNADLYGQTQKSKRPYNWICINTKDEEGKNRTVLLEVNPNKNNVEVVHWHFVDKKGLEKLKRQAEREDGQLLILPSNMEEVGALSDPTISLSSGGKDTNISDNSQKNGQVFSERLKNAISETETEPTDAQKKAGNYKKGHLSFGGYNFTVETPKGVTRSGKDENGKPWSVTMHDTYGYILGKIGVDGDHIDMFINDSADLDNFNGDVIVIDQVNPETGEFDEHKVMYGYPDEAAATTAYLKNYSKDWKGLGKVTSVPKATFDKWLGSSDRKVKPFREYAMVKNKQKQQLQKLPLLDEPVDILTWMQQHPGQFPTSSDLFSNGQSKKQLGKEIGRKSYTTDKGVVLSKIDHEGGYVLEARHGGDFVKQLYYPDGQLMTKPKFVISGNADLFKKYINYDNKGFLNVKTDELLNNFMDSVKINQNTTQSPQLDNSLPFDAPMSMDDLPFMRTVKPIMPKDMNEAQQVAFKAVQTMLKNAGIPVKVISNEDMDKVAAEYDGMVANMLLHDPNLRFNIKTPEEREAAERAYNWGKENRPDKWHQYVLVNMDRPNQMPEYFQKKSLADIQRRYYNKNVYDDWGELRGKPWGNYKLFDLNRPFEEQVKDVKGSVPTDYDPHRYDNKEYRKLKDQKEKLEAELEELDKQRSDYMNSTMDKYVKELGLNNWDELPDDIWYKARREGFAIVDEKKKAIQAEIAKIEKKMDNLPLTNAAQQEHNAPSPAAESKKEESSEDKQAKLFSLLDKKRNLETEYEEAAHNLEGYTDSLLDHYRQSKGLASDAEVPGTVFENARNAARALYKKKMDACMTELNNLQKEIDALAPGGRVSFLKGKGVAYGYTDGKQIVLNQDYLNPNTPLHEYQHIWRIAAKEQNPDLIKHGDDLIRQTSLYEKVKNDPNYSHLSDEEICDEAFARLIGQDGEKILEDMANEAIKQDPFETAKELSVINRLKKWLKEFWYWTLNTFTKWKPEDIKKMTLQDIRNLVLRDLANGVDPRKAHEEYVKQKDAEYMDAVKNGDMEKAAEMVKEQANLMKAENPLPDQTMAYKTRNMAAPKKTIKVYKTFTLDKDGDPSALFVSGKDKLPIGVWLDGQDTYHFLADNGKYYVPSTKNPSTEGGKTGASIRIPNDEVRQQLIDQGYLPKGSKAKSITALAYRPGWHAGDLPFFPQGGKKVDGSAYGNVHRYNQVVFECEMDADKDYTPEAQAQDKARNADGSLNARNADLQYMPEGGYYSYTTNPMLQNTDKGHWFISGSLKINRALTQEECDRILAENGKAAQEWEQGILDLDALNYDPSKTDVGRKMLSPVTYDDNGNVIPLSQRFNSGNPNARFMRGSKDDEYLKAVEDGDIEKAQKMVNEAAERVGYVSGSDYQGTSAFNGSAPWGNGYFLTKEERKEAWDNDEYDGDQTLGDYINRGIDAMNLDFIALDPRNYRSADPMRKEAIENVRNAIRKKSKTITMYRSVPADVKEGSFRNGDWVTPSRSYAVDNAKVHGWGDNYNIIEQKVPVDEIWWDGNDIAEWGYGREEDYINDTDFAYKNTKNNKKLLDAVTYDDNGNVIPLSQRFNEENSDIRFSLGVSNNVQKVKMRLVENLSDSASIIRSWLKNDRRNKSFSIELPLSTQKAIKKELGRIFNEHIITANNLAHAKANHGVNGKKVTNGSIPLRDQDFELMPYIITSPDFVRKGSVDSTGRYSIRFYKKLSNGYVVVVEKEQKNSPNDMETITMWAESTANGADALSKRKSPTIDARNVIINANDAAKIRKDAEIAIENDLKFKQRLASGGDFNNYSVVESKKIVEEVQKTATQLGGAEANVYTTIDDVPEQYRSAVEKGARGWYDPATHTVHIYLPNCADAAEAQRTVFHEKIGHEGMEVLLGGENEVRKFADYVYKNAGKDIREKILSFANKYDPNWKDNDRMNVGTQEYIAHLAEEGPKTAADFSLWTKIKHYLIRLLKRMGIRVPGLLNDKDLRYYLMKAGKALHVWDGMPKKKQDAMMQQATTKDIKNALGEGDMKGKPRQKKGESAIQYMKRVMEWRRWKEAREDLDDPEPPQFYDLDKDAAGKKEWEKLNKEWRDRHRLKGNDMPSLPTRNEGESDESFLSRYKDYEKWQNAMKDNEDPAPDMFAWEKQKQVEASKKYEDWLARHELLEQQQADLDLYEGKIYPAETSPEAADMERKVMQDLAEVTSTDVSSEGAARTVKVSVIHRRKNMEEASADDAIYINDVKRSIEQMAESGAMDKLASDFKGSKSKAESLAEAIPYIIEAPRRLRDLTHEMNASGVFDKNHLHIQPKDVEDIQTFVPELRRLASMTHTVVKNDKEVKVFDDMEGISKVASEMAKVINGNHQGEDYFVPIDGTDILDKQILPIVVQSIVPDGIDYHNLSEEMKSTLSSIRDWYNYTFDWLKDNHTLKEDVGYNADYVNHIWDKEKSDKKAYAMYVENRQRTKSPNEKKRTISTLMEGTGVGLVPKTTDITKMMAYYSRSNIEAWANKTMLQELSGINVIERDEDGEIISSDPLISSTAPFNLEQYKYFEIPGVGPVWVYNVSPKQVGKFKNPITEKEHYLYKEASAGDRFGVVFDTYQSNNFWKFMDTAASSAKKLELGFSGFHAGALTEVYMVQNMIEYGPEKALANFMKYIFVDTAKTHSLPCFANPEDFQEAATHLVKFGATNDYAAADVQNMFDDFRSAMEKIQKKLEEGNAISRAGATAALPLEVASQMLSLVNKGMDVALWDFLHDGLKLATYRMRADATKARAAKQGWTQEQLSKQLDEDGQFVNDMFGGQHWDVLGVSHTTLRYAGRILLSPDWNTSTTRHFLAVTGYGSVWNEATMNNFKQYYQHVKNAARGKQEMTPEDWGRFSRSKSALLCYGLGFMVFYEAIANGLNAAFRALDEERERKKAEELRKTNPDYRSPYELAYPDGMQWYDYLMRGNSLGQQSKIFLGRYEDGTEMYIRHGKQFREVPEYLFNHKGDLEFPGPMVQRMLGKANPMVRMTLDDINYLSDFQASHADQELQRKYGKTLGLLYKDALYWAPFLIPSQENKEFKAVDFFFPSSKGFSNWKAQDYFKTFILSGDSEGVWQTYASCQRNGLDAEKQLQAAIASIKALELKEMQDGVTSLQIASERFDDAKSVKEKRKMREKMRKFLSQSEYQAFTWQNAQDMVDAFQNGEDVKELTKADDKYLNVATSQDVTEDWRIQSIRSNSKGYADKLAELQETDKAKAAAFKNAHANIFKARKTITKANSKMNKLKKKLGEGNDKQVLQQIRNVRQELLKDLKNMEHLKKYED